MKVLDLHCALDHAFEGWFASEEDFLDQQQRELVQCPFCGSHEVRKALSAPRLNLRGGRPRVRAEATDGQEGAESQARLPAAVLAPEQVSAVQAMWLRLARQVVAHTEDVGERFAAEARRMHYDEIPERGIRGQATEQETRELLEEGVAVLPLLMPEVSKSTLQ